MDLTKLKELLDSHYEWPSVYMFKFVGNSDHKDQLCACIGQDPCKQNASKSGKHVSYTFNVTISSSEDVISIYTKVSKISGIMSL